MNTLPVGAITIFNGKPTTNSRIVAEIFEKRHDNVLRDIKALDCSQEFSQLNFQPSEYTSTDGRTLRQYDITLNGFTRLAMGYTGARAAQFKEQFLTQFGLQASEQALHTFLKDFDPIDLPLDRFIYVAREAESGRYKVGISKSPYARVQALNVGNPEQLNLVAVYETTDHLKLQGYALRGERFASNTDLTLLDL